MKHDLYIDLEELETKSNMSCYLLLSTSDPTVLELRTTGKHQLSQLTSGTQTSLKELGIFFETACSMQSQLLYRPGKEACVDEA